MGPLSQPHPAAGALLWGCARRGAVALTGLPGGVRGPGTVPGTLEHCRDTSASLGSAAGTTGPPNCLQEWVLRPGVRFGGCVGSPALPWEGPWQGEGSVPVQVLPLARLPTLTRSPKPQGHNVAGCPTPSAMTSDNHGHSGLARSRESRSAVSRSGVPPSGPRGRHKPSRSPRHFAGGPGPPGRQGATHVAAATPCPSAAGRKHQPFLGRVQPW